MHKKPHISMRKKTALLALILSVFLVVIGGILGPIEWDSRENTISAMNGELIPFPIDTSKPFNLYLSGGFPIPLSSDDIENGFNLAQLLYAANLSYNQFTIHFDNSKMYVSAVITNSNNQTIANIHDNNWQTVNPDSLLFLDRNYNAYAFEILGINGIPTIQVVIRGPNEIQIGGLFYTKNGRVDIAPMANGDGMLYLNPTDEQLIKANIPTLFKYPALTNATNLGKMINPLYPSSDPLIIPTVGFILSVMSLIFGTIFSYFTFDSYSYLRIKEREEDERRQKKRQERENKRTQNSNKTVTRPNPYYRKKRDRRKDKN
jgi:hypothetical protein